MNVTLRGIVTPPSDVYDGGVMPLGRIFAAILGLAGIVGFWLLLGRYQRERQQWQLYALGGLAVFDTVCLGFAFWKSTINPYAAHAKRLAEARRKQKAAAAAARLEHMQDEAG
jgi:hypothetical protein